MEDDEEAWLDSYRSAPNDFEQDLVEGKAASTSWSKNLNSISYRFTLDRGSMVRFATSFYGVKSLLAGIYDSNGELLYTWAPQDGGTYGFFALPAGTYYFTYLGSVERYFGPVCVSYATTHFSEPENTIYESEPNDGSGDGHTIESDATPIEIGRFFGGSYYNSITGIGDLDYYKFTVPELGRYSMMLATDKRMLFALVDSNGNTLKKGGSEDSAVAESNNDIAGLDFGILDPGTYYLVVTSSDSSAVGSPYYGVIFNSSAPFVQRSGVNRISGATRYDTMSKLSDQGNWAKGGTVILASGANYPDALAASSLAGLYDAPILLTDPNNLSDEAREQLSMIRPSFVYIVGGNYAISPEVESEVDNLLGSGCRISRLAGQTRIGTSVIVAQCNPCASGTVIIATSGNYADALSISPFAFATSSPIILSDASVGLADGVLGLIQRKGFSRAIIVGGESAVPQSVAEQLASIGVSDVTRLSGETRYETSARIADYELASGLGFSMDSVFLATGSNFPDALAAGPLAGRSLSPLLLVDPDASLACSYFSAFRGNVRSATVVGGINAVPDSDMDSIAGVLGI